MSRRQLQARPTWQPPPGPSMQAPVDFHVGDEGATVLGVTRLCAGMGWIGSFGTGARGHGHWAWGRQGGGGGLPTFQAG